MVRYIRNEVRSEPRVYGDEFEFLGLDGKERL